MTFRDPPIKRPSFDVSAGAGESQDGREVSGQGEGSGSESPPRRRKTPYMLPAPPAHTVGDEEIRRMELSEKQKERLRKQIEEGSASQPGLDTVDSHRESEVDAESQYETDGEGEDEFARMVSIESRPRHTRLCLPALRQSNRIGARNRCCVRPLGICRRSCDSWPRASMTDDGLEMVDEVYGRPCLPLGGLLDLILAAFLCTATSTLMTQCKIHAGPRANSGS